MKFFFDLEETLITEFDNPVIMNKDKVKQCWFPPEVGIFSFAMWNETDRIYFTNTIKPLLEDVFGFVITEAPTIDEITEVLKTKWIAIQDRGDIFDFFDKERAFIEYCRLMYPEQACTLIDDRVHNTCFRNGLVTGVEIKTININDVIG